MIEVEKQFCPTDEQVQELIRGAEFLGEITNHDVCYDYSDYRFFKKNVRLRNRNSSFELKIGKSGGVSEEVVVKKEIEKYFGVANLEEFVKNNLIAIIDYESKRKKYRKEDFVIDIDEMNFGYKLVEIELMVEKEEEIKEAEEKILNLAKECHLELKRVPSKREEYFRLLKPEVYKMLYGKK